MVARKAVYLANYREFADPVFAVEVAKAAESTGWDGFFVYDTVTFDGHRTMDAWATLGAVAQATSTVTIGAAVTPVARSLPTLAHQSATLAALAPGRTVVGLGAGTDADFAAVSPNPPSMSDRAAYIDLALTLLPRIWRGEKVSGEFVERAGTRLPGHAQEYWSEFTTGPVPLEVAPRLWLGGFWPNLAPMRRGRRADGVFPIHPSWPQLLEPEQVEEMVTATGRRGDDTFDVVLSWSTEDPEALQRLLPRFPFCTWHLEAMLPESRSQVDVISRVLAGP